METTYAVAGILAAGLLIYLIVALVKPLGSYMAQLRRKLEADPARPRHLRTEPGVGYRLVTE